MSREVSMAVLVLRISLAMCFLFVLCIPNSFADRLIRRSDGDIFLLGLGIPDAKKETVLFRSCNDRNSKLFSLKDYLFQSGKDCGPPKIFSGVESIRIEGTNEPHKI